MSFIEHILKNIYVYLSSFIYYFVPHFSAYYVLIGGAIKEIVSWLGEKSAEDISLLIVDICHFPVFLGGLLYKVYKIYKAVKLFLRKRKKKANVTETELPPIVDPYVPDDDDIQEYTGPERRKNKR